MRIAYIRVSHVDQNWDRQLEAIKPCKVEKIFKEKVSGKNADRPQLKAMLEFAREGDAIYVEDFSRLARSVEDLLRIVSTLKEKGVELVSLKERIDSSTPGGKLQLTMIGAINEFERANTLERQREGIALAKARGVYKGRKKIDFPPNWEEVYLRWQRRELTATAAMKELRLKSNTFYKLKAEYEKKQNLPIQ